MYTKHKIFIVDDDARLRKTLNDILKAKGYTSIAVDTGAIALDMIGKVKPAVALIDLKLEDMSGLEVMNGIKECSPDTEFIVLTGHASKESAIEAVNLGAFNYILKPYDIEQLLLTIDRAIEKLESREVLRKSEERYRSLVENIKLGITLIDSDYNIVTANAATGKLYKKEVEGFIGKKCYQEFKKREMVCPHCPGTKVMSTKLQHETETESILDDGSRLPVFVRAFPVFGPDGTVTGFIEIVEDITEKNQAEEEKQNLQSQLFQAQKMESIGKFAGSIAHDFSNMLFAINGLAELTLQRMDPNDPLARNVEGILDTGEKGKDLTKQLLTFSRKQKIKPEILNMNEIIENMQQMLRRLIGINTNIKIIKDKLLWRIKADHSQIEQVIMNLVINARDAMPKGGDITIKAENAVIDGEYAKLYPEAKPGKYALITLSDTGCGMTDDVKEQIFEPFFTTKGSEEGTGLGLATVYGIVKQNNGFIEVYSKLEKGTTFKIYIPCASAEDISRIKQKEQTIELAGNSGTVLLVEDEKEVRGVAAKVISGLGYTVIEAENGQEAYDKFTKYQGEINLLLTDMIMPGMSGGELSLRIKESKPTVKVIYMSGYICEDFAQYNIDIDDVNFLQKPITTQSLTQAVTRVLK